MFHDIAFAQSYIRAILYSYSTNVNNITPGQVVSLLSGK